MKPKVFQELYKKLNTHQKKAVDIIEGPVMVVAGPGTGKTQILTLRIANILQKTDVPPDAILALTFTEAGVSAMRKRLVSIIGSAGYRVGIFTFHGFCNDIIKRFPEEFPRIIGSSNVSDIDKITIIKELIEKVPLKLLRPYGDMFYYLHPVRSKISELKRENISPDGLNEKIKRQEKLFLATDDLYHNKGAYKGKMKGKYETEKKNIEKNNELLKLYHAYEEILAKRKLYDYEDMILEVIRALEEKEDFRLRLQEEYQYILADEHQDANNAQNRLLELLTSFHESPNLFIVGDEKQAIYRFQGASLENFLYFKKKFPGAREIILEENYRSTQTILDSAHSIIDKQKLKAKASFKEEPIKLYVFSKTEYELAFIAEDIQAKIKKGIKPEEIAVLYRDNRDADALLRALEKVDVPFVVESDQNILSDPDMQKFLVLLRAVDDFGDERTLIELLHIDFLGFNQLDLYKVITHARTIKRPLFAIVESKKELQKAGVENITQFTKLYQLVSSWRSFSFNRSLPDLLEIISRESGFVGYLVGHGEGPEKLEKLSGFFEEVKSLVENHRSYKLKDLLYYFDLVLEHNVVVKKDVRGRSPGRVRLMTAHRSKGLEFDYVYIVGATDGHWGNRSNRESFKLPIREVDEEGNDADERRLFYVALTRARKEIAITYSKIGSDGKEELPSQFVEEIKPELVEVVDVLKIEKKFTDSRAERMLTVRDRKIPIGDKEYLNELFRTQGLSVTALNNYLECPWQYFYNNLIRIPHVPNKHLLFGNVMHDVLESFFNTYKEGSDLTKKELLELFDNRMKEASFSEVDFEETHEKGRKALAGYYDTYKGKWLRTILNEFKIKGVLFVAGNEEIPLNGKLDKIEILEGNRVNVVDYKTGKPKSRNVIEGKTKSADANYKRQLVFYKLLLDLYDGGRYEFVSGELDFLEPDEKGKYHKEKFAVLEEEVSELKQTISRVVEEISTLSFWDKKCVDKKCEYCALRKMM